MYKGFTNEQQSNIPFGGYYHSTLVIQLFWGSHKSDYEEFYLLGLTLCTLVDVHGLSSETSTFTGIHSITSQDMEMFSCLLGT
jgi:hypothetical protein